ncbi:MAG TPA: CBS domain-containing protein [Pseudonocardiaceae bacterium]|nr:CBS domain-containing protein [Pseudonocardiaceae bacterium]
MRARDVMSRPVVTVLSETTVKYAANLLASRGFTALPVVDGDDRLIGIVTEADLIRDRFPKDARYRRSDDEQSRTPARTVGAVMTSPVTTMNTATDVADLITAMWDGRIRSMPIVDDSRVVGIVTRRDLVRIIGRDDNAIEADVRHRLANYCGPDRWVVAVEDGVVSLGDEYGDDTERRVAQVLAEAVPGVVAAHVTPSGHQRRPSDG